MSEEVRTKRKSEDVMVKQGNESFKVSKSMVVKYVALLSILSSPSFFSLKLVFNSDLLFSPLADTQIHFLQDAFQLKNMDYQQREVRVL